MPPARLITLTPLLIVLWSAPVVAAQGDPSKAEIDRRVETDKKRLVRALDDGGVERLRSRGSCTVRFRPLVSGDLRLRLTAGRRLLATAREDFDAAGSYRVKLRATKAGRRYLRAQPDTRWKLSLKFLSLPAG